jgi:hypothetical protein
LLLGLGACAAEPAPPSAEELVAALLSDPALAVRADVETGPETHFDTLVRAYDRNGDYQLTPAELAGRDFGRFDRDTNGLVTLSDFPGESGELEPRVARGLDLALAHGALRAAFGLDWQARFRTLDLDANMRLSRAEFEVAVPARAASRRDLFAALLASAGSWGDDRLDWAEVDGLWSRLEGE